ncbi:MAG TPA: AroM family protein [Spirochaetales bacterium]|nr:AroM family protein [Spirochaetales bacterium]HOV39527.1 AroM family protein [Spirochaetales bacterium]
MGPCMKIGALTIGQSPRKDVTPEFLQALGKDVELLQCGALDGLSQKEIEQLAPGPGDYILVTRLNDGTEVKIAEKYIHERMKECAHSLVRAGAEFLVLFCTGEFPELEGECLLLKPDVLMEHVVPGILKKGKMGAILPSRDQIPLLGEKWKKTGLSIELSAASPYTGKEEDYRKAARELAEKGVDLIVLDCIGFNGTIKQIVRETAKCPVILPRTLLGRIAGELIF